MADLVRCEVVGSADLDRLLSRMGERGPKALGAGLYQEAETVMTDAKTNYVPVDTGALRASGQVQTPDYAADKVSVTLGFGDASVGYAVYVHENLTAHHPVGQAKYLEVPLLAALPQMPGRIAERIRAEWGV